MRRQNNNNIVPAWAAVLLDVLIIYIAYTNLGYNRRGALASEHIARELRKVNESQFMNRLNGELEKEKSA